jgi:hypothetical protein
MNELLRCYGARHYLAYYDSKVSRKRESASVDFSATCDRFKKGSTYTFYFPMTSKMFRDHQSCYWCIFSEKEIVEYLEDINRMLDAPITWDFEYMAEADGKILRLSIHAPKKYNGRQCLYILTRIRQLAEMPFALYLKDAIRLWKTREEAGWDSIEHCFWRVLMCLPEVTLDEDKPFLIFDKSPLFLAWRCSVLGHRALHPGDMYTEWEGLEVYKTRFKEIGQEDDFRDKLYRKGNYETKKLEWSDHFYDLDFWMNGFELRLPVYLGKGEGPNMKGIPRYPDSEIFKLGDGPKDYYLLIFEREGIH